MPLNIPKHGGIRAYHTTVTVDEQGRTVCTLYRTKIAIFNPATDTVTLDTGGYDTPTTIRRMNECLHAWGFKASVGKADFRTSNTKLVARTPTALLHQ
jgi:hypothetical protein